MQYIKIVNNILNVKANSIKKEAKIIEIVAKEGVSLRSGSNVITVNQNGIFLNSKTINPNSSYSGLNVKSVDIPNISKPILEKLKIESIYVNTPKQNSISDTLIFDAKTLIYQNDSWIESNKLDNKKLKQIHWIVVKNNDKLNNDIVLDDVKNDDDISINETRLTLNVSKTNVYKYAHVFCFANNQEEKAYALVELKRDVKVIDVKIKYLSNEEVELKAMLNVEKPNKDELENIRWLVEYNQISKYNGQEKIKYNIKDENVYEIDFNSYINSNQTRQNSAKATAVFDEDKMRISEIGVL